MLCCISGNFFLNFGFCFQSRVLMLFLFGGGVMFCQDSLHFFLCSNEVYLFETVWFLLGIFTHF